MSNDKYSRKDFLKKTTLALATLPLLPVAQANPFIQAPLSKPHSKSGKQKPSVSIFSKHLQWLNTADMASLAAQLGYDGIDLTVRQGGHVLPGDVARDLPKAVEVIRKAGLEVFTITTDIKSVSEPYTENILRTAESLGIENYRMGWYDYSGGGAADDLKRFGSDIRALAALNEKYHIHGDYENHTGRFGGPIWDLWLCLRDLDPRWIGCQFDIRHATIDGAEAWPGNLDLLHPYLGSITVKDFHWQQVNNKWETQNVPLGQGMIDFMRYFKLLKQYGFQKPISQHFEYALGGAESGAAKLTINSATVVDRIKADLQTLRKLLGDSQLG